MPIQDIATGDFVNQGREKVNQAFGEIPVGFDIDLETGELVITKHNNEVIRTPLANVFARLEQVANSLLPGNATHEKPGLIQLGDDADPNDLASETLVLPAAAITRYVELVTENLIPDLPAYIRYGPIIGADLHVISLASDLDLTNFS